MLVDALNRRLVWERGRIAIDGLTGAVPFDFRLETIEIHDREGVWAEFEGAHLQWSFADLVFIRRITVNALTAEKMVLHRSPGEVPEEIREERPDLSEILDWHWPFYPSRVDRLAIRNIVVPSEIVPGGGVFSFRAGLFLDSHGLTLPEVRLVRLDRAGTRLELTANWRMPASSLGLNLQVYDRNLLPELTGYRDWPRATAIKLTGRGGLEEWHGELRIVAEPEVSGNFTVSTELCPETFSLAAEARVEPFSQLLPPPWNEYASEAFSVDAIMTWNRGAERLSGTCEIKSPMLAFSGSAAKALSGSGIAGAGKLALLDSSPLPLPPEIEAGTPLSLGFNGRFDPEVEKIQGEVWADLPDLAMKNPENPEPRILGGHLKIQGRLQGDISRAVFRLDTRGELRDFFHHQDWTQDLAGEKIDFEGVLEIKDNIVLMSPEFSFDLARGKLDTQGEIDFSSSDFSFSGRLELPELSWLEKYADYFLSGSAILLGEGQGEFAAPAFEGRLSGRNLIIDGRGPLAADLDWSIGFKNGVAEGRGAAELEYQQEQLELAADFVLPEGRLQLVDIRGAGFDLELTGDLDIRLETGLADGRLCLASLDLVPLSEFLDLPLAGALETEIDLKEKEARQDLAFEAKGREITWSDLSLDRFDLHGTVRGLGTEKRFSGRLELEEMQFNQGHLETGRLELDGNPEQLSFISELAGSYGAHPVFLEMRGNYLIKEQTHQLTASRAQGNWSSLQFVLHEHLQLDWDDDQIVLHPSRLDFGSGRLELAGEWASEQVRGELTLRDFPLSDMPFIPNQVTAGEADLDLDLTNSPAGPELSGHLKVENLEFQDMPEEAEEKLKAEINLQAKKGELEVDGILRQAEDVLFAGNLSMPVSFSLAPVQVDWPEPVPLEGRARGEVDLQQFVEPWLPAGNMLSGLCYFDLELVGDLQDLELAGKLELEDGSFEQLDSGLYLTDLQIQLQAQRNRFELKELRATDGADGELGGTGFIELSPEAGMPWAVKLKLQEFRAIRQRLAGADIASAEIDIGGDLQGASIKGEATMGRIQVEIGEPSPPELVELPVTEINRPEAEEPPETEDVEVLTEFPVELDLQLSFPARAYVRGHGLDSEWQGNLTIGGTANAPQIRGQLEVVRGHLKIFNRRLSLDRESFIVFDGSVPVDPAFDLLAHYRHRGRQVSLRIYGSPDHPEFDVTSDPAMPQEEALAWLIFGRSLSDLTPIQAVQLINAARTMASDEPGYDVMGRARALLGVEEIEILPAAEGGTAQLGLGRYVHDRVYLQVRTGMGFGESAVLAEVELTPRIGLESSVGAGRERGIGIFWSYDY